MELRVLRYFLAGAQEESISDAAKRLHITQPTLSRQLMELEDELGMKLFHRGGRNQKIALTEPGRFLRQRAQEIIVLADKTEAAFSAGKKAGLAGVYIAAVAGETDAVRLLARSARVLQEKYPQIRYQTFSGDAEAVEEHLEKGVADFGLLLGSVDPVQYDFLTLPIRNTWGVLIPRDTPLAQRESIRAEDLWDKPLIVSQQKTSGKQLSRWLKKDPAEFNVAATYNLPYNAYLMAAEGLGCALVLDNLINVSGSGEVCFRPLEPRLEVEVHLVWKKYRQFSRAAELFLSQLRKMVDQAHGRIPA